MTLEGQIQGNSDFEASIVSCKGAELGHMLLVKQVCKKLPFVILTAGVKQRAKVHGPFIKAFLEHFDV